ncbi:MAG: hypothetical protein ACRD0M_05375, partial [Acidimicrobiales bacterium]
AVLAGAGVSVASAMGDGAGRKESGHFATLPLGVVAGLDLQGVVHVVRGGASTSVELHLNGLEPGVTYAAHLHNAPCTLNLGGGHYKYDPAGVGAPPNELWASSSSDPRAGITANPGGVAHGSGSAEWVAGPEAQAVVIHAIPPGGTTAGGPKIACADLG